MVRFAALVVASCVILMTSLTAVPRWHFSVVRSTPAKDQSLTTVPTRLQVWFSEAPAAGVSKMTLVRGTTPVALKDLVIVASEKSMYAEPAKPLEAGAYTLNWRAAGDDGHVMTGEIKFTVTPKIAP